MNIIIPAAGKGTRFQGHYDSPKNLIDVKGDPMLIASAKSLQMYNPVNTFIFLIPEDESSPMDNALGARLKAEFPDCKVFVIMGDTEGAADTLMRAADLINNDEELLIVNSDQIMEWNLAEKNLVFEKLEDYDAGVVTVKSDDPKHSYINLDTGEIVEKEVVSDQALTGLHWWKHGKDFVSSARLMMQSGKRSLGEYYIGPVYNSFNGSAGFYELKSDLINFIGTPEDLKAYLEK